MIKFLLFFLIPNLVFGSPLTSALKADLGRDAEDLDTTCEDLKSLPVRYGLIILGSEKDLATAEKKLCRSLIK